MSSRPRSIVPFLVLAGCLHGPMVPGELPPPRHWPTAQWSSAPPEELGLDSRRLAEVVRAVEAHGIPLHSLMLVRSGEVVLEACFAPYDCERLHDIASVTKSVVATLVGIAAYDGVIDLADPVSELLPEAMGEDDRGSSRWSRITVEDLLGMTTGLECGIEPGERELYAMVASEDWVEHALSLPEREDPGERFAYCSPGYHLLSAVLSRATGRAMDAYARTELFEPLGIESFHWPRGPRGLPHGWGDLELHPRDMAKLGLLYLQGGRWEERRLLSEAFVRRAVDARVATADGDYGLGWWLPAAGIEGLFEARGRSGQQIVVWPDRDLVLAVTAGGGRIDPLVPLLLAALRSNDAIPADPEGVADLARAVEEQRVARPGPPISAEALALARRISGRRFVLAGVPGGVEAMRVEVPVAVEDALSFVLERDGRVHPLAVGLDGRYRFTEGGPADAPVAARVRPSRDDRPRELGITYTEPAGVNHFDLAIEEGAGGIVLCIGDPSGHFDGCYEGRESAAAPSP